MNIQGVSEDMVLRITVLSVVYGSFKHLTEWRLICKSLPLAMSRCHCLSPEMRCLFFIPKQFHYCIGTIQRSFCVFIMHPLSLRLRL